MSSFRIAILSTCALAALSPVARAGTPDTVETVVVTALKRTESIQAVPASITALSGAGLEERGISDIEGLQFAVPSVETGALLGDTQITIRGIGEGPGGASTAIYVDGVYQPIAALADLTAIDMGRVEVLRGPQGTLYGRNAIGGAVNFISNAPTQELGGNVSAQYETYDEYRLQGVVNVPLTSTIAARATVNYDDREEGFIKNVIPGQEDLDKGKVLSGRLRIGGQVTDNFSIDLNLQGKHANGPFQYFSLQNPISAGAIAGFPALGGAIVPLQPWRTSANGPNDVHENYGVAALTADWTASFGDVKSITAYQSYDITAATDQDGTNVDAFPNTTKQSDRTFTEELNLSTHIGPVDSIFGAFYMNEKGTRDSFYPFPIGYPAFFLPPGGYADYQLPQKDVDSRAVYADLTWNLSDQLRLIGGLRYSEDRQTYRINQSFGVIVAGTRIPFGPALTTCPTAVTKLQFDSLTGKVGAQFDVAQDQNVYGTVATGYLSGGLNDLNCSSGQDTYKPEKITSYEVGYKSRLFDEHLIFNVAAFYYDFTNLQVTQLEGFNRVIENAASSTVKGAELETDWVPDSHWLVSFSGTYLDAHYLKYLANDSLNPSAPDVDVAGNRLSNSPGFSGNLSVAYRTDTFDWGQLVLRADSAARSRIYFRPFNQPLDSQSGYGLLNLGVTWYTPNERYSVRVFDNNVTNTAYIVTQDATDSVGSRYVTYGTPNQIGVQLKANF
ncbi:MAG: TonB-dependent receptor [Rhizomicrobium sp.]